MNYGLRLIKVGIILLVLSMANSIALGLWLLTRRAEGAKDGLFAEKSTTVDGVSVRRICDTSNGIVCYVASSTGYGPPVSIACLKR